MVIARHVPSAFIREGSAPDTRLISFSGPLLYSCLGLLDYVEGGRMQQLISVKRAQKIQALANNHDGIRTRQYYYLLFAC